MKYKIINNQTSKKKKRLQKELENFKYELEGLVKKSHDLIITLKEIANKKKAQKILKKIKK